MRHLRKVSKFAPRIRSRFPGELGFPLSPTVPVSNTSSGKRIWIYFGDGADSVLKVVSTWFAKGRTTKSLNPRTQIASMRTAALPQVNVRRLHHMDDQSVGEGAANLIRRPGEVKAQSRAASLRG
jgi:hypothetical protein